MKISANNLKSSICECFEKEKPAFYRKQLEDLKDLDLFFDKSIHVNGQKKYRGRFLTYIKNSINWKIPTITITDDDDDFWTVLLLITQEVNWRKSPEFLHLCWLTGSEIFTFWRRRISIFFVMTIPQPLSDHIQKHLIKVSQDIRSNRNNGKKWKKIENQSYYYYYYFNICQTSNVVD